MKSTILIEKSFKIEKNLGIEVGIASGASKYEVIELKKPSQVGVIGVKNGDEFSINFKPNYDCKFGLAVYLDGINVNQSNEIINLNSIPKEKLSDYHSHSVFIGDCGKGMVSNLNRYNQKNNENRVFTFTTEKGSGINEILISDSTLSNRIEIFLWIEYYSSYDETPDNSNKCDDLPFSSDDDLPISFDSPKSKIGAGRATKEEYSTSKGLNTPDFLGKITFIHLNSESLNPLKKIIKNIEIFNNQMIDDPMNKVPKT